MNKRQYIFTLLLFFLSGVSALIYEILWLKELGLLFGNSSHAMATTLAAFFMGLAVGSYHWGRRVAGNLNPLRLYGFLELGVAFCALGYFLLLKVYGLIYPGLFAEFGNNRTLFTLVKFFLSIMILFPPAYFMGGTLPVISHFMVRSSSELGRKVSILYAINTLGAVTGVFLAGFYLPAIIGFSQCYRLALMITVGVAIAALLMAETESGKPIKRDRGRSEFVSKNLQTMAFFSGFLTLGLQVLWGRMFAQVLQNSVYTFSLILMVFLSGIAIASVLAHRLMRSRYEPGSVLYFVLLGGALLVAVSPFVFMSWTDSLHYIGSSHGWHDYLLEVALMALVIMGCALLLLGMVFPLLIKLGEQQGCVHSVLVGRLSAVNTAGAIIGSLSAGFVILELLGLWGGIRLMAVIYFLLAGYWLNQNRLSRPGWVALPAVGILLSVSLLDTGRLPVVKVDPVADEESLLEAWQGSAGTVAVIRRGEHLKIKVNNYYTLGGTGSLALERFQAGLPIQLHQQPRSVYILGLGTGITAGGALAYPIEKLVVTELLKDVVTASEKYFGRFTNSLFFDPRVQIIAEDGRNYLRGTEQQFDVIISDLFVPWKAGVGSLYSLEHYQTVYQRLQKHGLFMQWIPTYQLSESEFAIIIRTMQAVFPQITVWRGDFSALKPVIGLLGHKDRAGLLEKSGMFKQVTDEKELPLLMHYVGNLESLREQFKDHKLNTDDKPIIEFNAPVTQRLTKSGDISWLAGEKLIVFMQQLQTHDDSYLSAINKKWQKLPEAGYHLQHAQLLKYQGKLSRAKQEMALYQQLLDGIRDAP